ncbi:MAG: extracellular solute-binding protein [Cellulosilyticaceae bacterium]
MKKMAILIMCLVFSISIFTYADSSDKQAGKQIINEMFYEKTYQEYLDVNGYNGQMANTELEIDLLNYSISEGMEISDTNEGLVTGEKGKITWEFFVKEAGFYNLEVKYIPVKGTNSRIERKIYLDDNSYFKGMEQISFSRSWKDENKEIQVKNNNEIRPEAEEIMKERIVFLEDVNRRTSEPYKFYLSKGKHTLTFESVKESMKFLQIQFKQAPIIKPYNEIIEELKDKYKVYEGENIICEAERITEETLDIQRSSPSIIANVNYSDSKVEPYHPYRIVFNTIGGNSWKTAGESITWTINAQEEGLYRIVFKGRQSNRGMTSYRRLKVNNEIPFSEAQNIPFNFSSSFNNYVLGEEEPYLFYLNQGENTITLETVLGKFGGPLTEVEESVFVLNELYRRVIQITGVVPDKYIDYEVTKKIPEFVSVLTTEADRLYGVLDQLVAISGEKGELNTIIEKMALQATRLSKKPEDIIRELSQFKDNIAALGNWIITVSEMPLELDSILIGSQNSKLPASQANIFENLYHGTIRFVSTFFIDNTKVSTDEEVQKDAVKVWISTGRDQAQVLRNMIDESFTPQYNVPVNLELVPMDVVLKATLAGTGPDVVLSMDQNMLMDFAVRNALVDLSQLEGFEKEREKYFDSAIVSASYQNKVYGLPEQQQFMMMFYREDILAELGVEPPKTWEELQEIIPVFHMNNYDVYLPTTLLYPSLVFQNSGDIYGGEGLDYGIESALHEESAMKAFKQLTEFFTSFKLPVSADFSNRFRTGEIPLGITYYNTYNQLEVFAPEIRGIWSFAPLPGTVDESGYINNQFVTSTIQCTILRDAKDVDAAWQFLRWWMDTDTQVKYANTIEAIMGSAARYPTANKEVLKQLPWSNKDAEQLIAGLESTVGIPAVPGNYMTTRMIDYAFKGVVTDGQNPREAMYLNIKDINNELTKKRKEFGLSYKE